jgi:hypothetical protein
MGTRNSPAQQRQLKAKPAADEQLFSIKIVATTMVHFKKKKTHSLSPSESNSVGSVVATIK